MQLLESSAHWEGEQPGLPRLRPRCLPPSSEGLLGRGGLRPFFSWARAAKPRPTISRMQAGTRPGSPARQLAKRRAPAELGCPLQRQSPNAATLTSDPWLAPKGPREGSGSGPRGKYSPEEVVLAVELAFPGEALLGQVAFTFTALDALDVPGPVQHVQEEAVQDGPFAAGTVHHGLWFSRVRPGERRAGRAEGWTPERSSPAPPKRGDTHGGARRNPHQEIKMGERRQTGRLGGVQPGRPKAPGPAAPPPLLG